MYSEQMMIRCAIYRGGTSKGVYLLENDLPRDPKIRDQAILAIYGSPDPRQINGLGGADSLTSKVAIIGPSSRPDADVDYTFGQVSITEPFIDYSGNCGNISSGVGPFAIDEGLVKAVEPITRVRIFNTNTQKIIAAEVPVVSGQAAVEGGCAIAGVPGSGACIMLDFVNSGGAVTGKLLPTANVRDVISVEGYDSLIISIVDAANPCVFIEAKDLGIEGTILPAQIDADLALLKGLEDIRGTAAEMIGLVRDRREATEHSPAVPKMIAVSEATDYCDRQGNSVKAQEIDLVARAMSMQKAHKAYPVTGAICTAAAAKIEGTIVNQVLSGSKSSDKVRIGHPSGIISVEVAIEREGEDYHLKRAALERTARRILTGYVYVPKSKFRAQAS